MQYKCSHGSSCSKCVIQKHLAGVCPPGRIPETASSTIAEDDLFCSLLFSQFSCSCCFLRCLGSLGPSSAELPFSLLLLFLFWCRRWTMEISVKLTVRSYILLSLLVHSAQSLSLQMGKEMLNGRIYSSQIFQPHLVESSNRAHISHTFCS